MGIKDLKSRIAESNLAPASEKTHETGNTYSNDKEAIIAKLKRKNASLAAENKRLRDKPTKKVSVSITNNDILVIDDDSYQHAGKVLHDKQKHSLGSGVRTIYPALKPIMDLILATTKGVDITTSPLAKVVDGSGRPTKEPMKDANGKNIRLASRLDVVKTVFKQLENDPDYIKSCEVVNSKINAALSDMSVSAQIERLMGSNMLNMEETIDDKGLGED